VPLLARAMLKSALAREESRGAHYRSDFPDRDDARFRANSAVYADGTEIRVAFEPVKEAQNA
jgi:succinate dehydrogenase / fumarate reductase flavoprotein subunit